MALFSYEPPSDGAAPATYPKPPSLHWGLVLLFSTLTFGTMGIIYTFRQATWLRRIDPTSKAVFILAVSLGLQAFATFGGGDTSEDRLLLAVSLLSAAAYTWAYFVMRESIQDRFAVDLSGLMTFFFNVLYLQYHLTRIARGEYPLRYEPVLTGEIVTPATGAPL